MHRDHGLKGRTVLFCFVVFFLDQGHKFVTIIVSRIRNFGARMGSVMKKYTQEPYGSRYT